MFSEHKTRGFNLEDSQIERSDRLDRLVMDLSLALYWAVSTGMRDAMEHKTPAGKNCRRAAQKRRPKPDVLGQAWSTPHSIVPATPHQASAALERVEK